MLQWAQITVIYYVNMLKFMSRGKRFLMQATNPIIPQQALAKPFKYTYSTACS